MVRYVDKLNPQDVPHILRVIFVSKSAGVRMMENLKIVVESLKMTLRPIQLQVGVCQTESEHVSPHNSPLTRCGGRVQSLRSTNLA
jgi:hypothetical protein